MPKNVGRVLISRTKHPEPFGDFFFNIFSGSQIFGPLDFRAQGPGPYRLQGPGPRCRFLWIFRNRARNFWTNRLQGPGPLGALKSVGPLGARKSMGHFFQWIFQLNFSIIAYFPWWALGPF